MRAGRNLSRPRAVHRMSLRAEPAMHLTSDKKHADLEIRGTFDVAQLELLIRELSAVRAEMEPPVSATPPAREGDDAAAARARGDPVVQVAVMRDGHTRF